MLTNEKVLEVFKDYLTQETEYELLMTSRGYIYIAWEGKEDPGISAEYCGTPERLLETLLGCYEGLLEEEITGGSRDLTEEEASKIRIKLENLKEKCLQE